MDSFSIYVICYSIYVMIGFLCILYCFDNIVIRNRKPFLMSVEQISCWLFVVLLYFDMPCIIAQSVSMIALSTALLRVLYLYQYLVPDLQHPIKFICRIFWHNHSFQSYNALIHMLLLEGTRIGYILIVSLLKNPKLIGQPCVAAYKDKCLARILSIPLYIVMTIIAIFAAALFVCNVNDKIGMKWEFGFTGLSSILIIVISNVLVSFNLINLIWGLVAQAFFYHFWSTWLPLLFVYKHNKKRNMLISISGRQYDMDLLLHTSRRFFCQEIILFIDKYREYLNNSTEFLYRAILEAFIKVDAPFELNMGEF